MGTREEGHVLRRMAVVPILGKRRRGMQKTKWNDSCNSDIERAC